MGQGVSSTGEATLGLRPPLLTTDPVRHARFFFSTPGSLFTFSVRPSESCRLLLSTSSVFENSRLPFQRSSSFPAWQHRRTHHDRVIDIGERRCHYRHSDAAILCRSPPIVWPRVENPCYSSIFFSASYPPSLGDRTTFLAVRRFIRPFRPSLPRLAAP